MLICLICSIFAVLNNNIMMKNLFIACSAACAMAFSACGLSVGEKEIAAADSLLTSLAEVYTVDFDTKGPDDIIKIDYAVLHLYKVSPEKFSEGSKSSLIKIDEASVAAAAQAVFVSPIVEHQSTNEVDYADGFYEIRRPAENQEVLYSTIGDYLISGDTLITIAGVYSGKKDTPRSEASLYKSMNAKIIFKDGTIKVAEYREAH